MWEHTVLEALELLDTPFFHNFPYLLHDVMRPLSCLLAQHLLALARDCTSNRKSEGLLMKKSELSQSA
jgi:hypothetical protein